MLDRLRTEVTQETGANHVDDGKRATAGMFARIGVLRNVRRCQQVEQRRAAKKNSAGAGSYGDYGDYGGSED